MSLVGSLEDLGLGDMLQIVHLAGKSGVLALRGDAGEGQIVFRKGMIREAHAQERPDRPARAARVAPRRRRPAARTRLARGAPARPPARGRAGRARSRQRPRPRRAAPRAVEGAVLAMFALAFGRVQLRDARAHRRAAPSSRRAGRQSAVPRARGHAPRRRARERSRAGGASDELGRCEDGAQGPLEAELVLDGAADDVTGLAPAFASEPRPAAAPGRERAAREPRDALRPLPRASPCACRRAPPVMLIDPSLAVLEWAKAALGAASRACTSSSARARHRAHPPVPGSRRDSARGDRRATRRPTPAAGARDANEIVARLKRQAPACRCCCSPTKARRAAPHAADGMVVRPPATVLADRARAARVRASPRCCAETLARVVRAAPVPARLRLAPSAPAREPDAAPRAEGSDCRRIAPLPPDAIAQLRETSARMRERARPRRGARRRCCASRRESFSRVALFGVRGDRAVGVAQSGLARAGGPDDDGAARAVARQPRAGVVPARDRGAAPAAGRARPTTATIACAVLLGNEIPAEAYVAPIVTGDRVAALLYARQPARRRSRSATRRARSAARRRRASRSIGR